MAHGMPFDFRMRHMFAFKMLADQVRHLQSRGNRPGPAGTCIVVLLLAIHALRLIPGHQLPLSLVSSRAALGLHAAALQPHNVIRGDWARLAKSAIVHLDAVHLTFNLCSFLGLAVRLERTFGSVGFMGLVVYLAIAESLIYVGVSIAIVKIFNEYRFYSGSVAGFSGVVFGLMAILSGHPGLTPGAQHFFGMIVPGRWLPWKELFLCKILLPESSLLGHLCGILAGMAFLNMRTIVPSGLIRRLHVD